MNLFFYEFENTKKLFSFFVLKAIFLDLVFKNWEQKIGLNIFLGDGTHKRTENEMKLIFLDLVFNNWEPKMEPNIFLGGGTHEKQKMEPNKPLAFLFQFLFSIKN